MSTKRALIFANGSLTDLEAVRGLLRPGDYLVAADGGARHLASLGLRPDLLVGDLDSLTAQEVAGWGKQGVEILRFPPEKDETDLELALQITISRGYSDLTLLAALGGRIDQTLANIFLLGLPGLERALVRLDDGRDELFLIHARAEVHGKAGEIVSLLPLGGPAHGVTTRGLRYPLREESLFPERTRGISNELLTDQAEVSLREGVLLCIHTRASQPEMAARLPGDSA